VCAGASRWPEHTRLSGQIRCLQWTRAARLSNDETEMRSDKCASFVSRRFAQCPSQMSCLTNCEMRHQRSQDQRRMCLTVRLCAAARQARSLTALRLTDRRIILEKRIFSPLAMVRRAYQSIICGACQPANPSHHDTESVTADFGTTRIRRKR
jgi:hypothetical protein